MDFSPSPRAAELTDLVGRFVREEIEPVQAAYHRDVEQARLAGSWAESPIMADLRAGMDGMTGGPRPFAKADRSRFLQALDQALVRAARVLR